MSTIRNVWEKSGNTWMEQYGKLTPAPVPELKGGNVAKVQIIISLC